MKDKFAYYDFIANIIPGIICLWLLHFFGIDILDTQNIIAESILYIVVAYVFGLAIQFFAKFIIEPIIKTIYWENTFYSNISLIKNSGRIDAELRDSVIEFAKSRLNFDHNKLELLNAKFIFGIKGRLKYFNKEYRAKVCQAHSVSYQIYRRIDAYTKDKNIAIKAHEQNNYYSLFRGLSMVFLGYLILAIFATSLSGSIETKEYYLMSGTATGFIIFLIRAKERGELYIKGLYNSVVSEGK